MPRAICDLCLAALATMSLLALSSCASGPSFPDPQPGKGQIMVSLKATPKAGVTGPRKDRVVDDYATSQQSVERGRQFERVKYDAVPDVVVLCSGGTGPRSAALVAGKDGLDHDQLALSLAGAETPAKVSIANRRDTALTFVAVPRDTEVLGAGPPGSAMIADITVAPGQTATLNLVAAAIYDLSCDEDENLSCVVYVTNAGAWIGSTRDKAFFDGLAPGEYDLVVYGPRLPVVRKTARVAAGARTQADAELTVNGLKRVGH